MDFNRNQLFFIGVVVLLIGIQFRMVSTYVLNKETTQFLTEYTNETTEIEAAVTPNKVIKMPEWTGWCSLSIGAVLILHSLAMEKPQN